MTDEKEKALVSINQDLLDALAGKNGFGGDVAEIYVYRLTAAFPRANPSITLYNICRNFAQEHGAKIEIEARVLGESEFKFHPLGDWVGDMPNDHRWHVRVKPAVEPEEEDKEAPRVTAADLLELSGYLEKIYSRAVTNMQGDEVCQHLREMQGPLVLAVGKLTILEARKK